MYMYIMYKFGKRAIHLLLPRISKKNSDKIGKGGLAVFLLTMLKNSWCLKQYNCVHTKCTFKWFENLLINN